MNRLAAKVKQGATKGAGSTRPQKGGKRGTAILPLERHLQKPRSGRINETPRLADAFPFRLPLRLIIRLIKLLA
jgi:hypothetical protein